jgi:DNA primase
MSTITTTAGLAERYERSVLPHIAERLDAVFPAFGWERDARGWHATDDDHTHALLGCRADRVVCHGDAPRGILIHGQGPVLFTTLANAMQPARGRDFVRVVQQLAETVGVDLGTEGRATQAEQRARLLHDAFVLSRRELRSERGAAAVRYLVEQRGFPADTVTQTTLGVVPAHDRLRAGLTAAGWTRQDIDASNVLADDRWPGRIVGAWRDETGHARTLWTRSADPDEPAATRYLYLRCASRTGLPPYELSCMLADRNDDQRAIVLVEGLLDVHHLRAHGITNVAALGGVITRPELFSELDRLGVHEVTLMLDADEAGLVGTIRAIDNAVRAERSPDLYVARTDGVDAKDPDELLRRSGPAAIRELVERRRSAASWRVEGLLEVAGEPAAGVRRAGEWLGRLGPRWALEQDDAVATIARAAGRDEEAVRRAFRARYWRAATASRAVGLGR